MHPPSLSHLKVFGCLCYSACPKVLDKFSSRLVPIVFMGDSSIQKECVLYDIHDHSFIVRRHLVFQEHLLLFKNLQAFSYPMFSVLELVLPGVDSSLVSSENITTTTTIIVPETIPSGSCYP